MQENAGYDGNTATSCARKSSARRECGDLVHEAAQATDEKQGKKRNFTRSRKSLFENANSRNAILKRQTADGESRTRGGQPSVAKNEWRRVVAKERGLR